ncbi:hypothetical protein [Desulforamulus ferrireducens]|jgi:hypothetical protein|uniref:Colicin D immunity protein domain-containing protein n=1 Tax=Desulforamulus ferrireducens TaxID=1833852 RepID=A0A1S6IXN0_9FIRM|nr:hypothetical protein [Desulforamulus ferrireducens]AQS58415.1 hypothetical protein B0537_04505 [Desulforamulus ferrireducens]AQS58427.1 hypothetical protein B0537_04575 [Desulforamulus ferrireducens]AQS59533.1 hypothetical protein B0537_10845 [Desulforamulus ferrireducens]AQS59708.1 hypothetical protein B0537_11840 [Desulforamulus ferrireducens]AQS60130.1 hypothetical protein B0537_14225 [Desulforamulus ferrireducens]
MSRGTATKFMMTFVQEYLDGKRSRLDFDLDFNHYLIKHYAKMERENPDLAECFNYYLAEEGFDQAVGLSDDRHRRLIQKQFNEFKAALRDGFF